MAKIPHKLVYMCNVAKYLEEYLLMFVCFYKNDTQMYMNRQYSKDICFWNKAEKESFIKRYEHNIKSQ